MAEMATSASTAEGLTEREAIDLKAIRSRIGEISKEIKHEFEPIDSSITDRDKLLEDCASQYREIMRRLECQDSNDDFAEGLDSHLDNLMKEMKSVDEEATKINLEMDSLMNAISADTRKMEIDLEECDYMLHYVGNDGGQSDELNSSQVSSFQHHEFEMLELDRQIEESQWRLKIMKDLDSALASDHVQSSLHFIALNYAAQFDLMFQKHQEKISVDTLTEASSLLSDLKVLEVKDNCIRLFLTGPIITSDGILMGQKLDLSIEKPINSDHELLIEFAEDNMEVKKMEIFPDDVSLNETFEMIKTCSRDFRLAGTTFLRYVVRLVQQQILLCTARRLLLKDANKSRHSFEYSQRDKMVTVHLVGGVDAFIEVPLNWPLSSSALVLLSIKNSSSHSQNLTLPLVGRVKARVNNLEHSRHHLVRFADAIEEILVREMQSEV